MIRFEDLRADTHGSLRQILAFLGVELSGDLIDAAVRNNSLERMRAKEERAPTGAFSKGVERDIRFINTTTLGGESP